jgi:hypothetical protein
MTSSAKKPAFEEAKKTTVPPPSNAYKFSSNQKKDQPKVVPGSGKFKSPSSTAVM